MNFYLSFLHSDFIVIVTDDDFILKVIGKDNVAICLLDKKLIIINKLLSKNWGKEHYMAIEAHEISHYIAGHYEIDNIQSEKEADKMAYIILKINNFYESSKLIEERFNEKYKINIKDFKLNNKLKIKISIFIFKFYFKKIFGLDRKKNIYNFKKLINYVKKR